MSESLALTVLTYLHVLALSLWFGGLFGYLVMVWPAIMSEAGETFPRELLVRIAVGTAPWIYLGMATAVLSFAGIWAIGGGTRVGWMAGYSVLLLALAANNVYGTMVAWPRIMFAPERRARAEWHWFRLRMTISLVVGLALHASAIIAT
jgi:uncharacterized membrane protein